MGPHGPRAPTAPDPSHDVPSQYIIAGNYTASYQGSVGRPSLLYITFNKTDIQGHKEGIIYMLLLQMYFGQLYLLENHGCTHTVFSEFVT